MQDAVRVDRKVASLTGLVQRSETRLQMLGQAIKIEPRLAWQAERRQMPVAVDLPLCRRNQQLVSFSKRQAMVDPHRAAAQPLAQTHYSRGLQGTQRALAVLTVDQVAPTGAHWHIAVWRQLRHAPIVQTANEIELAHGRIVTVTGEFQRPQGCQEVAESVVVFGKGFAHACGVTCRRPTGQTLKQLADVGQSVLGRAAGIVHQGLDLHQLLPVFDRRAGLLRRGLVVRLPDQV